MKVVLIAILVIFSLGSVGQSNKPEEKTLLWQITGKNIQEPSYLYGTIHIMCPGDLTISDVLKQKFSATQQLFLEIKLDDPGMLSRTFI